MNETLTALIETAQRAIDANPLQGEPDALKRQLFVALPALRASLARDAALEQYIGELRSYRGAVEGYDECADRLTQILEGVK